MPTFFHSLSPSTLRASSSQSCSRPGTRTNPINRGTRGLTASDSLSIARNHVHNFICGQSWGMLWSVAMLAPPPPLPPPPPVKDNGTVAACLICYFNNHLLATWWHCCHFLHQDSAGPDHIPVTGRLRNWLVAWCSLETLMPSATPLLTCWLLHITTLIRLTSALSSSLSVLI